MKNYSMLPTSCSVAWCLINHTPTTLLPSTGLDVFSVVNGRDACNPLEPSPSLAASDSVASLYLRISYKFRANTAPSAPLLSAFPRPLRQTLPAVPPRGNCPRDCPIDCPLNGFPTTPFAPLLPISNHANSERLQAAVMTPKE